MKGTTKLELNQATMIAAIQKYFTEEVFDASQLARVIDIEADPDNNIYMVTIDSEPQQEAKTATK